MQTFHQFSCFSDEDRSASDKQVQDFFVTDRSHHRQVTPLIYIGDTGLNLLDETNLNDIQSLNDRLMQQEGADLHTPVREGSNRNNIFIQGCFFKETTDSISKSSGERLRESNARFGASILQTPQSSDKKRDDETAQLDITADNVTCPLEYSKSDITTDDFQIMLKKSVVSASKHRQKNSSLTNFVLAAGDLVSNNDSFNFSQLQQTATPNGMTEKMTPILEQASDTENHF
jgi:hypothetical protein